MHSFVKYLGTVDRDCKIMIKRTKAGTKNEIVESGEALPGPAAPLSGTAAPLPGTAAPLPGTAAPLPGTAAPLPGTAAPLPGPSHFQPHSIPLAKQEVVDVEPDCLMEPVARVTLEGIIFHETEDILLVNTDWRGKTYVGTLLDSTNYGLAPSQFREWSSPDLEQRTPKVRGEGPSNNAVGGSKCRRVPTAASPTPFATLKVEPTTSERKAKSQEKEGGGAGPGQPQPASKRKALTGAQPLSPLPPPPVLLECPEPNCYKKYKRISNLKNHQSHAHGAPSSKEEEPAVTIKKEDPEETSATPFDVNPESLEKPTEESSFSYEEVRVSPPVAVIQDGASSTPSPPVIEASMILCASQEPPSLQKAPFLKVKRTPKSQIPKVTMAISSPSTSSFTPALAGNSSMGPPVAVIQDGASSTPSPPVIEASMIFCASQEPPSLQRAPFLKVKRTPKSQIPKVTMAISSPSTSSFTPALAGSFSMGPGQGKASSTELKDSRAPPPQRHVHTHTGQYFAPHRGKKIPVGREHQAIIPPLIPPHERNLEQYPDKALLVYSPPNNLSDKILDMYINMAIEKYGYNIEQALGMLFWHKHVVKDAVNDLPNFIPFDGWTAHDKSLFEQAFQCHGKNFHRIRERGALKNCHL